MKDHNDLTPSFSINVNTGLWQCFGCDAKGNIDDLEFKVTGEYSNRMFKTYPYRDENGEVLYELIREHPKKFRFQQSNGKPNLKGVRRILYNLRDVMKARTVYVTEGEKDAETLKALELKDSSGEVIACTTNPFGAKSEWREDYNVFLAKKDVVIFADADETGLKHAVAVGESVSRHANSVRIVQDYPPDAGAKDVSDFLENHSIAELLDIIKSASFETPKHKKSAFEVVALSTIKPEQSQFLEHPYLLSGALNILEGDPCSLKTWIALAIAAEVTLGRSLVATIEGRTKKTEPRSVVYLTAEDALSTTIRPRFDSLSGDPTRFMVARTNGNITLANMHDIEGLLAEHRPAFFVLDPLQAYIGAGVDMHRANETRPILSALGDLAERYNCAFLAIRHLTKASGMVKAMYKGMGSIDISAAARSVMLTCIHPDDPDKKVLCHTKHNCSERGRSIVYSIKQGVFGWIGYSDLTPETIGSALAASSRPPSKLDFAKDFLQDELANGPKTAIEVKQKALVAGHSWRTVEAAKKALYVNSRPNGFQGEHLWSLSELQSPQSQNDLRSVESLESSEKSEGEVISL
jgi:hypothetical protein